MLLATISKLKKGPRCVASHLSLFIFLPKLKTGILLSKGTGMSGFSLAKGLE